MQFQKIWAKVSSVLLEWMEEWPHQTGQCRCFLILVELPVDRPKNLETTALGAAYLAGMQVGFYPSMDEFSESWQSESQFNSKMTSDSRERKLAGWKDAVKRTLSE